MMNLLKRFHDDETGATAIEYALIGGLIALAIVGGVTSLGDSVEGMYDSIVAAFED